MNLSTDELHALSAPAESTSTSLPLLTGLIILDMLSCEIQGQACVENIRGPDLWCGTEMNLFTVQKSFLRFSYSD